MESSEIGLDEEKPDLGAAIDERLQVGATAGNIAGTRLVINSLIELLLDKNVFTSEELSSTLKAREKRYLDSIEKAFEEVETPEGIGSVALNDYNRFVATVNNTCQTMYEKLENNMKQNEE